MSKQQKNKGKKTVNNADADEDWDKILSAEIATNALAAPAPISAPASVSEKVNTSMENDDEDDDDEDETATGPSSKDKKKKKKKPKKDKDEKKDTGKELSAAGKAILLRQQQIAEEEARVKKLLEEQEARIRAEEEAEAARLKAIEDEKDRKRKAKQDKVEAQKAAGTYMTKGEKEKARRQKERLEAMKLSGALLIPGTNPPSGNTSTSAASSGRDHNQFLKHDRKVDDDDDDDEENGNEAHGESISKATNGKATKTHTPAMSTAPIHSGNLEKQAYADISGDSANCNGDDWESNDWESAAADLDAKVSHLNLGAALNATVEEDDLQAEAAAEQAKLKELGLERARRDEEARVKREVEEREREEEQRKEREAAMRKEQSKRRRADREAKAKAARSPTLLRSPISCIMGHVDTGKTKLLDKIRHTNVQDGEAGGITQQIGATQFPKETLALQTQSMQADTPFEIRLPGLLMIDTPGHEAFSNLRNRGSTLCDVAILVIDLMHGLEPQTIESLNMLRKKNTPFIVALNKVDRCYGWKTKPDSPVRAALAQQDDNCRAEFKDRSERIILQLNEQGLNAKMYWDNDDPLDTVSLVPTSAISGEGIPDLLYNIINLSQERLVDRLMYMESVQCTVLEVKAIDGLGYTIDAVLLHGTLREGDSIVVSTMDGPVVTSIRALLTPPPNREMRVKSEYVHHSQLSGAIGVKIVAPDVGRVIAGTPVTYQPTPNVFVVCVHPDDELDELMEDCQSDLTDLMKGLATDTRGVTVHASTLGALEALLQFLREECKPAIPVSHISIGTIYKKDVTRASIMHDKGQPEFATILAFDVKIDAEALTLADEVKVRIFTAEIIYHLFDQFSAYMRGLTESRRATAEAVAVYPCVLKILPQHIFNKKDPIVFGVEVVEGVLKIGTPICVPSLGPLDVGRVTGIENNHKEVTSAKKGLSVSVKITNEANPTLTYGRQFDHTHALYSKISRASIDALKEFFKDDVSKEDWALIVKLKKVMNVP